MIATLISTTLALQAPTISEAKVVAASLFKNGYAMVVREVTVKGDSTLHVMPPMVSLGTFWVTGTDSVKVREMTMAELKSDTTRPSMSFAETLRLNIGKDVTVTTATLGTRTGKLLGVQGEMIVLQTETVMMFPMAEIRLLSFPGAPNLNVTESTINRGLRVRTSGQGKILLMGLERGLTWAPSYALELLDKKNLRFFAKSTVLNDLGTLDNVELRFVTGFPNVPWATLQEPLLSGQSVDQFVNFINSIGGVPDGRGSGFSARREMMTQNMASQAPADFGGGWDPSGAAEQMAEDLFFYRQPNVSLKQRERSLFLLFEAKAEYDQVFICDLQPSVSETGERFAEMPKGPADVWNTIRFTNTAGQPLTTAPLTVFKDGQVLGQDTMSYTSAGSKAQVKMSKALDIRIESEEEEVSRQRQALKSSNGVDFDLVTLKGTISVRNRKADDVKVEIAKRVSGEVTGSTGTPKVTKLVQGLRQLNPTSNLKWEATVSKGGELTLTYTFQLYQRSF